MLRLPAIPDEGFNNFLAEAVVMVGPEISHSWLWEIWERHGHRLPDALAQLTESRLRRNIRTSGGAQRRSSSGTPGSSGTSSAQCDDARVQSAAGSPRQTTRVTLPGSEAAAAGDDVADAFVETSDQEGFVPAATVGENIQVLARFRPMSEQEIESQGERECVEFGDNGTSCVLAIESPQAEVEFAFSRVFQPMASQEDVYEAVSPTILSVVNGINASILAYGQTGSGKTHTMMGPNGAKSLIDGVFDDPQLGIIPRALLELQNHASRSEGAVSLRVSYIEIYQEKVRDLLTIVKAQDKLKGQQVSGITSDNDRGLFLPDVVELPVESAREAMEIMQKGNKYRTKACTKMNQESSRSHAIFVVSVENNADPVNRKFAQLYLVDLAGSERADKTGVWGKQLDEAKIINKSLLALGQVIVNLSEKASHIPYRDSKLTRVLQNVLGGNSRTTLICAASPHPDNANESLSTLRFGNRASRIRNETRMNIVLDPKELKKQLDKAKMEIEELKRENAILRQEQRSANPPATQVCEAVSPPSVTDSRRNTSAANVKTPPVIPAPHAPAVPIPAWTAASNSGVGEQFASGQQLSELIAERLFTRQLLPSFICPLTGSVMREPMCAADGATYERSAIERVMRQSGRMPSTSPVTGKMLASKALVQNSVLKLLIASNLKALPPPEVRIPAFAKVSIYLLDHIFMFLGGRALGQAQRSSRDFFAVGAAPRLWAHLVQVELGRTCGKEEDARKTYAGNALAHFEGIMRNGKSAPLASRGLRLVNLG